MLRRLILSLVLLSLLSGFRTMQSTSAQESVQATVVVSELNVRSVPAIGDNIIGQFVFETRITVLGREDVWNNRAWLYVTDNTLTGWVLFNYVRMDSITAYQELPILLDRSTPTDLPITGHTNGDNLRLRNEPSTSSDIITVIADDTPLTIVGHDDIWGNRGIWLEVDLNDGSGLHGWVSCWYVILDGIRNRWSGSACYDVAQAPVTATDGRRTLEEPIEVVGLTMARWQLDNNRSPLNIRQLPSTEASILGQISPGSVLGVYGTHTEIRRNPQRDWWKKYLWENMPWFYVVDPVTGTQGWVYFHYYLHVPLDFDLSTLPVLETVEHPDLPSGLVPVSALNGVVTRSQITLRVTHPDFLRRDPLAYLDEGTSVVLVGRDARIDYVYVQVDGMEGWVAVWTLDIDGDPQRLPIMYINSE